MRTRGLAHLNLNVSDLERSARFYTEVFGLAEIFACEKDGARVVVRQVVLGTPGQHDLLALTQADSFAIGPGGVNHFGFLFVDDRDVEAAVRAVERNDGRVLRRGERDGYGVHETFAYVSDPDGYAIELSTQAILLGHKARNHEP